MTFEQEAGFGGPKQHLPGTEAPPRLHGEIRSWTPEARARRTRYPAAVTPARPDLEARVVELETRILFLEEELAKLSQVLIEAQERTDGLERELARLKEARGEAGKGLAGIDMGE
jgi:uncharacterized coiled-coil protein SlyX